MFVVIMIHKITKLDTVGDKLGITLLKEKRQHIHTPLVSRSVTNQITISKSRRNEHIPLIRREVAIIFAPIPNVLAKFLENKKSPSLTSNIIWLLL